MSEGEGTAEGLVERLFGDLLGAVTMYGVYLGEQLGLYEALASGEALTPAELAKRAGIHERYAREWLEQQAADSILTLEADSDSPDERRFALPRGHAEVLTDRDSLNFFAPFPRMMVGAGLQLPALMDAYRTGGGVPWSAYSEAVRVGQGEANRPLFLQQLGPEYLANVEGLATRLEADPPARVAEIGSGMGWASIGIARSFPKVSVDGYDLDQPSIEQSSQHAREAGLSDRVRFHGGDAAEASGSYDLVFTAECIHDLPHPVRCCARCARSPARTER